MHAAVKAHHQNDYGMFTPYELWRREVFKQWAVDKSLLQFMLKDVITKENFFTGARMADFGAGGGHYSKWINETGLLTAHAFDGIANVADYTNGRTQYWNL